MEKVHPGYLVSILVTVRYGTTVTRSLKEQWNIDSTWLRGVKVMSMHAKTFG